MGVETWELATLIQLKAKAPGAIVILEKEYSSEQRIFLETKRSTSEERCARTLPKTTPVS